MKADTYLTLADLQFSRYEIPSHLSFGGEQALAIHELVGGNRIVDSMGRQDKPLEWSGVFFGDNATDRANYLNWLRIDGSQHTLTWGAYRYQVIIKSVTLDFERFYQIPYSISCVVVYDGTNMPSSSPATPIDSAIGQDLNTANTLTGSIGDGTLSGLMNTLNGAISSVSTFAHAAQSTISSVMTPLQAVQARVSTLIAATGNTIANIATLGGVLPNNPIAKNTSTLTGQITGFTQMPLLLNLQNATGRMAVNLNAQATSGTSVTTASGSNLFSMASQQYGDPTAWTTIARANNLTDPQLTGIQTVILPASQDNSAGVFGS